MNTDWQQALDDVLKAYFGYQGVEAGVDEMVFVTASHDEYHRRYLSAIEGGIAAAERGDAATVAIVLDSNAALVQSPEEARSFLADLRDAYLARYRAETAAG